MQDASEETRRSAREHVDKEAVKKRQRHLEQQADIFRHYTPGKGKLEKVTKHLAGVEEEKPRRGEITDLWEEQLDPFDSLSADTNRLQALLDRGLPLL